MRTRATNCLSFGLGTLLVACGTSAGPAAITVFTTDGPAAGIDVVFHDSSGAPTEHVITGADGRAAADVDEGGMITVLMVDSSRLRATFLDVRPDDDLTFVSPRRRVAAVGTVRVKVGAYPGAAVYVLEMACAAVYTANVATPIAVEIRTNCLSRDGTLSLLATALDSNGEPLAGSALRGLDWVEPMDVTMPGWAAMATFVVDATNAPAAAQRMSVQLFHETNGARLWAESRGVALGSGGSASLSVPYAPGFGYFLDMEVALYHGESSSSLDGASLILERRASPPGSREIDLAAELLPPVSTPVIDATDPVRPEIAWTASEAITRTDGGALRIDWTDAAEDWNEWVFLLPPDVSLPLRVPALPDELAAWAPDATIRLGRAGVMFVDADWIQSYGELRAAAGVAFAFRPEDVVPRADATMKVVMAGDTYL